MVDFHGRPASAAAALAYIERFAPRAADVRRRTLAARRDRQSQSRRGAFERAAGDRRAAYRSRRIPRSARRTRRRVIQPDICHCGGLLEAKKIAAMAEAFSVGVAPHNPLGPIAGVAALHFAVSTPNHVIQEEMVGAVPWYFEVVSGPIRLIDGFWQVPEAPDLASRSTRPPAHAILSRPKCCILAPPSSTTALSSTGDRHGRLDGKIAIMTGAGRGIGEAIARAFVREGARSVVAERDATNGQAMAASMAGKERAQSSWTATSPIQGGQESVTAR